MKFLEEWGARIDELAPAVKRGGQRAEEHACRVIDLLQSIDEGVANLYTGADAYEYPRLVVGTSAKTVEGRQGYRKVITNIGIVAGAAADVDLFIMSADNSGFVQRFSLAAAGRSSATLAIPVPEGQPIFVLSSLADVQVNLIVRREKP